MNKLDTYLNFIEKTPYKYSRLIEFEKELYQKYGTGIVLPIWYFLNEMETKELIYLNSIHIIDHNKNYFLLKKIVNNIFVRYQENYNLMIKILRVYV